MGFSQSLLAILVAALWGGNFVAAKLGLADVPPVMSQNYVDCSSLLASAVRGI